MLIEIGVAVVAYLIFLALALRLFGKAK